MNSPSQPPSHPSKHSPQHPSLHYDEEADIRSTRLETRLAKKRLGHYKNEQYKYDFAVEEAANVGIHPGYSHQQNWIEEYMKHVDVKKNHKMHELASKLINKYKPEVGEISHILDDRVNELKRISNHHKQEKENIKEKGGTFTSDREEKQLRFDQVKAKQSLGKRMICQKIIDENNAYLNRFQKSKNKCTIM